MNVIDASSRFTQPLICLSVADWCLNAKTCRFVAILGPLIGKQVPTIRYVKNPKEQNHWLSMFSFDNDDDRQPYLT